MAADGTPGGELRRLLGTVSGKRILELGCGTGESAIELAKAGATVIAVDGSAADIDAAREAASRAEIRIEFHSGDLADLAFLRADSIDAAYSDWALSGIADPGRLFRQVHRVLRAGAHLAFTLPHPYAACVDIDPEPAGSLPLARPYLARSYFDDAPVDAGTDGASEMRYPHPISTIFVGLARAGYKVDTLLEPEPTRGPRGRALVPETIVWRARKEGV